jgi:hypothetical protein
LTTSNGSLFDPPQVQACFEADTEINLFDSPSREFVREGVLLKQAGKGEQPSREDLLGVASN